MNKELAQQLNIRLGDLPFADKQAGLVQTVEFESERMGGGGETVGKKYERFPVSVDIDYSQCATVRKERDLVPDGHLSGISYFEDFGITPLPKTRNGFQYQSRLRFVCWMNRKKLTGNDYSNIVTQTMGYVIEQLTKAPFNAGLFTRISINVMAIPPANKALFSSYTYDEAVTQYLMPPYEYFAIDFGVKFTVPYQCMPQLQLTPSLC